jgi:hypothetical protein
MSQFWFCLFSFFSYKIREQEGRTSPAWGEGADTSRKREVLGKACRRMNVVQ